jgi:hypothetical protein
MPLTIIPLTSPLYWLFQEFIRNENLGKAWLIFSKQRSRNSIILKTFVFSFNTKENCFLDELYVIETAL